MKNIDKNRVDISRLMDYDSDNTPRYLELKTEIPNKCDLCLAGIIITQIVSDKADRKEREMDDGNRKRRLQGRYLTDRRLPGSGLCRWLRLTVLLVWDGVLLYMIADCLISPVYGAAFVGVISIYLGFRL